MRSNDSFNFPLELIKYIVNVVTETQENNSTRALSKTFVFFGCKKIDIYLVYLYLFTDLLAPEEDDLCRKRSCTIVFLCFVALVSTFH